MIIFFFYKQILKYSVLTFMFIIIFANFVNALTVEEAAIKLQNRYRAHQAKKTLTTIKRINEVIRSDGRKTPLMGIEIESGICKVMQGPQVRTGFVIGIKLPQQECHALWRLEDDTKDRIVENPTVKADVVANTAKARLVQLRAQVPLSELPECFRREKDGLSQTIPQHNRNLECRTVGGFPPEIIQILARDCYVLDNQPPLRLT